MKRILFVAVAILLLSCEDSTLENSDRMHDLEVSDVKAFFETEIRSNLSARQENEPEIVWDLSQRREIGLGDALIFPLDYEKDLFVRGTDSTAMYNVESSSFVFSYRKDGQIHIEIVQPVATTNDSLFTGYVLVMDWEQTPLRYFEYEKGKFITEWKLGTSEGGRTECYATDYYYCTSVPGPDPCVFSHTVISCRQVAEMAGPEPGAGDYGGAGGDPGTDMCPHPISMVNGFLATKSPVTMAMLGILMEIVPALRQWK